MIQEGGVVQNNNALGEGGTIQINENDDTDGGTVPIQDQRI